MNKTVVAVLVTLVIGLSGGYWFAVWKAGEGGMPQEKPSEPKVLFWRNPMNPEITSPVFTKDEMGMDYIPVYEEEPTQPKERKVLFWRNPMNPEITSPVFTKDEMGMDYIPVYEEEPAQPKERKVLFWRNPMNPEITSPVFTKDEMGMDYIPVYADIDQSGESPAGTVKIDATTVQNIGVRTTEVKKMNLSRVVRAVGRVGYDEQRLTKLHPKIDGWVESLNVNETGEEVKRDTILLSFYSPQLVATQQEYLLALQNYKALKDSPYPDIKKGAEELLRSARERLVLLDVPEHQIEQLESTQQIIKNLHIHSPFDGVVINIGVRQGQYITPKDELYMLADLRKVWTLVDIYEDEVPWVSVNDKVEMKVAAVPGRVFKGKVTYIYPYLESKTRTVKVRLEFDNKDGALKPDMYAEVSLFADRRIDALVVPSEAIVRSGNREQVFVDLGGGKFEPREVTVGINSNGMTQILNGLNEGETVVTSSQFLIDSESKLREATAKLLKAPHSEPAEPKVNP